MGGSVLEEELGPRIRTEFLGPLGYVQARNTLPQTGATECDIDQDGDAEFLCQRQDALRGYTVVPSPRQPM